MTKLIRRPEHVLAALLGLLLAASAPGMVRAASDIELKPIENMVARVTSVVPVDWRDIGGGLYVQGDYPAEPTLLAIQSAPAPADQVWPSLLPQLGQTTIPDTTGSLVTDSFEWSLYRAPGPVAISGTEMDVELAIAETDGTTHLVVLQALPDEFERLRDGVFLPAVEAFAPLVPEPTALPTAPAYDSEEVAFPGGSEEVELAGTLTLPTRPGPHPAVVLLSGSGAQDRDEGTQPLAVIKPFALLADALTKAGLAVLRYDDRGAGQSTGEYLTSTVQEHAADGAAALAYLRSRDDIDPSRIGVLGHSEGGLHAAMLAAEDPDIAFVLALATPAVDGVSLVVAQSESIIRASGASEDEVVAAIEFAREVMPVVRDGDPADTEAAMRDVVGRTWDEQPEEIRAQLGDRAAAIEARVAPQLPVLTSAWYRSLMDYDPTSDWASVHVPVLAVFGGKDVQVLAEQNEPALRAALERGGNEDVETVLLPDANHLFQASETGALQEYSSLGTEFTPELLPTIVAWLTEHLRLADPA
jgi:pimeloyl-ACP methyl ester carboxylesterase